MRIKSERDFWAGLMFLVMGVVFAWGALSYSFGSSARPGPGYFPFGLGVMLALIGAFILFEALTIETDDGEPVGTIAWRPLLMLTLSVLLFAVLTPRFGIVVSIPVLVVVASLASDEFGWPAALIGAVVLTVFSWLVFIKGLGLTVPVLPVGFGS
jgi:hypothetical protein